VSEAIARWSTDEKLADSDRVIAALRRLRGPQRLDVAYRSGKLIAEALYGPVGPDRGVGTIRPTIAADGLRSDDSSFDRSAVYRALRVFDVCESNPAILECRNLTVSHVVAVLRLNREMQSQLLSEADGKHWTVRQLKDAVDEIAGRQPRTGRPKASGVTKTLRALARTESAFEGIDSLLVLDQKSAAELLAICRLARESIQRAEQALKRASLGHSRLGVLLVEPDRTFALRAQRQLRGQSSMIRIVTTAAEAPKALAADTVCAIINLSLPDGSAIALADRLRELRPQIQVIFMSSRRANVLPAELRDVRPLIEKTSGLHLLKVALAKALAATADEQRSATVNG
jgi:hypothetical protein